jgi:hypothetical protein
MRSLIRSTAIFSLSVMLTSSATMLPLGLCRGEEPFEAKEFDSPSPKEYRVEYERDAANQKKQTWDQYWGWVKSFHEGTFFVSGWTERAKTMLDGVKPGPNRKKLVKEINAFGQDICKEWAKDSSVCKVGTADLTRWGKVIEKAKKIDEGNGNELARAVAAIREEFNKKVKPPPGDGEVGR